MGTINSKLIREIVRDMLVEHIKTGERSSGLLFNTEVTLVRDVDTLSCDNYSDLSSLLFINQIIYTGKERDLENYLDSINKDSALAESYYAVDLSKHVTLGVDSSFPDITEIYFRYYITSNKKNSQEIFLYNKCLGCSDDVLDGTALHAHLCDVPKELRRYVTVATVRLSDLCITQLTSLPNLQNVNLITVQDTGLTVLNNEKVYNFLYNLDALVNFDMFFYSTGFEEVALAALSIGTVDFPVKCKEKRLVFDAIDRGNYKEPLTEITGSSNYRTGTMKELARQLFPKYEEDIVALTSIGARAAYWKNKHLERK